MDIDAKRHQLNPLGVIPQGHPIYCGLIIFNYVAECTAYFQANTHGAFAGHTVQRTHGMTQELEKKPVLKYKESKTGIYQMYYRRITAL